MWNTFKYTLLSLIREKNVLIWALAFPLVLATVFNFMFANLDAASEFSPISVAIVEDEHYEEDPYFDQAITAVSQAGEDQLFDAQEVGTVKEAQELLESGAVEGYIAFDAVDAPAYHVGILSSQTSIESVNRTITKNFLDTYLQNKEALTQIVTENPQAWQNIAGMQELISDRSFTHEITVTASDPSGTVRYFYALLGFSSIMVATIGLVSISSTLSGTSALGARRSVGATSRSVTLLATLGASWLLSFCCLMVGYLYIRYVFGIDFGGKDAACIVALVVASLVSTSLGSFIGSIPRLSEGAKAAIMTGLSCFLALFAGLYGESSMQLADMVSSNVPIAQLFNPSRQVADIFYSLYYYNTYDRFFEVLVILLITAGILFAGAALLMRRQRNASV